jgi:protein-disulfide isomerase
MSPAVMARLAAPVSERDHAVGSPYAPVTLVEYGDYECPHCGAAHQVVNTLRPTLGPQLRFVYRHFPLATIHPHAPLAAEAAEAAGAQGEFWPMHDMIFEHQHALEPQDLAAYADVLGLDLARFSRELASHVHAARVREDFTGGVRSGVNGTPTFFINGVRHDGSYALESVLSAIEEAVAVAMRR